LGCRKETGECQKREKKISCGAIPCGFQSECILFGRLI
jgi:hypothetical protein